MIALSHHSIGVAGVILDRDKFFPLIITDVNADTLNSLEEFQNTTKKNKSGQKRQNVLLINGVDNLKILIEKGASLNLPIVLFDSITNLVRVNSDVVDAEQREDGTWLLMSLTPANFNYMIADTEYGYDGEILKAEKPLKQRKYSKIEALLLSALKDVPAEKQNLFRVMCFRIIAGKNSTSIIPKKIRKWGLSIDDEALNNLVSFLESSKSKRLGAAYHEVAGRKSPAAIKKVASKHKVGVSSLAYMVTKYHV